MGVETRAAISLHKLSWNKNSQRLLINTCYDKEDVDACSFRVLWMSCFCCSVQRVCRRGSFWSKICYFVDKCSDSKFSLVCGEQSLEQNSFTLGQWTPPLIKMPLLIASCRYGYLITAHRKGGHGHLWKFWMVVNVSLTAKADAPTHCTMCIL